MLIIIYLYFMKYYLKHTAWFDNSKFIIGAAYVITATL